MTNRTKLLLSLAVVAVIAAAAVGGTFAGFTDSDSEEATFDTGNVTIATDLSNTFGTDWAPGDAATGQLTVTNTGDNKIGRLTIDGAVGDTAFTRNGEGPALDEVVRIKVDEIVGSTPTSRVNEMTLAAFNSGGEHALAGSGTPAAANAEDQETRTYRITLSVPGTAANEIADLVGSEEFTVTAYQRDGATRTTSDTIDFE